MKPVAVDGGDAGISSALQPASLIRDSPSTHRCSAGRSSYEEQSASWDGIRSPTRVDPETSLLPRYSKTSHHRQWKGIGSWRLF
jgi:hypothetical protein